MSDWTQLLLECPVFFVPVLVRETVGKGAEDGEGQDVVFLMGVVEVRSEN
jgi:hypothetical protein